MKNRKIYFIVILIGLVLLKFWLVGSQTLIALPEFNFDDMLFIKLASRLAAGKWLGAYDKFTLSKGPFYPIWIALTYYSGIPLLASQHMLYIAACCLFTFAVRPILKKEIYCFLEKE